MRTLSILIASVLLLACSPDLPSGAVQGRAPLLGKSDSADQADHSCRVVLRGIGRQPGGSDYQTQCTGNVCNYVWAGTVEVKDGIAGTVRVLYRLSTDKTWWQVDATPAAHSQPGFVAYDVALSEHLFGPQGPQTAIELMPYVELADGSRLFDHNRRPGDLQNYVLDGSNNYAVGDDASACAPVAGTVLFATDWSESLYGALRQDGYLVISYAIERLPTCRGTHNGYPAWDLIAYARFSPGGQVLSGSVREFDTVNGTPTNTAHSKNLILKIPSDATAVELWFHNYTGAGSSCQAWDSDFGKNYHWDIWPPASDPRCKNIERWTTQNSDMPYHTAPYCLGYAVDSNADAGCGLVATGIGDGYMGHYGIPNNWVEVYLETGSVPGQVLAAGMFTRYRNTATNAVGERFTVGRQTGATSWQTGFIYLQTAIMSQGGFNHEVQQMAFFVDVKQASGKVIRLWQSQHGANYSWSDAFGKGTTSIGIPYGNIKYAVSSAKIFDVTHSCGK